MRTAAALLTLFVVAAPRAAAAQCSELVKDGVFETFMTSSENVSVSAFMNWVRDHRTTASGRDAGATISIPVIGGLTGSAEEYEQMESDYAAMQSGNSSARSSLLEKARTVSAALGQRFNECLAIRGLHVWLETTDDPAVFKVAAVFNSPGPMQVSSTVETINQVSGGLSCDLAIVPGTVITGSTRRMLCTRSTSSAVTISINADSDPIGGDRLTLTAIPDPSTTPDPSPPPAKTCDSQVLASRGAAASNERLTDGVIGPNSPGQNSGFAGGEFWVELPQPEWIHHVVLHPFGSGTAGTNSLYGIDANGQTITKAVVEAGYSSSPFAVNFDLARSHDVKRIDVFVTPANGKDWVAFTEIEVFVCH
jgi:hypothetical protein